MLAGGLMPFLLREIVLGIKTGRIRHSDTSTSAARRAHPLRFWGVATLYSGLVAMLAFGVWKASFGQ